MSDKKVTEIIPINPKSRRRRKKKYVGSTAITKASILGNKASIVPVSNLLSIEDSMYHRFIEAGAIEPPLPPLVLVRLASISNCLRQNLDAMSSNVHGFGHKLEPVVDLDSVEGWDQIRTMMIIEKEYKAGMESGNDNIFAAVSPPTDDEVNKKIDELKEVSRRQLARAKMFFDNACQEESSFTRLRKRMCVDKETTGYASWELRRDGRGNLKRLSHAPSWTMRAMPRDPFPTKTKVPVKVTDIYWDTEEEMKHFRRYVQIYEGILTYFKEAGDPRTVSATTGNYYDSPEDLEKNEPTARQATEIIWFKLDSSESEIYGGPRWSGNILSVMGSREMEEVNFLFWQNKSIPPMVVLISGGHLAKGAREKLERVIEDRIKGGRENFHSIMVIEAEPVNKVGAAGAISSQNRVKIELRPLTEAIWKDQLWGEYDKANRLKVGQSWRIPPIARGETTDFNRATAEAAMAFVEEQVYQPERRDVDDDIDRNIMRPLGIYLWRFRSNAPVVRQPDKLVDFTQKLAETVIKVNEARGIVSGVFDVNLPRIDAPWAEMPVRLALAGFDPESEYEEEAEPIEETTEETTEETENNDPWASLPKKKVLITQKLMDELIVPSRSA